MIKLKDYPNKMMLHRLYLVGIVSLLSIFIQTTEAATNKVQALPLPKYIGKGCSINDPKLNECVVKKGAAAIKTITGGDPKYRIPRLDPLVIEQIKIDQGTKQVGLSLELNKCEMHGLTNSQFVSANVDVKNNHCEWNFYLDRLLILGKYNVSGQVLVLPITGSGDANVTVSNVTFSYIYDFKLNKKSNGLDYVEVTDNRMPFEVGDMKIKLENLFNGDKLLGDNMNHFLNENWREIMKELGPAMGEALGEIFRRTLTSMAEVVPFQNIFPPN